MGIISNGVDLHPMVVSIGHVFTFCHPMVTIKVLSSGFSRFPLCGYYLHHGFPKSSPFAAIPPIALIQQARVWVNFSLKIRQDA